MKKTVRHFADAARDVMNASLDQLDDRTRVELSCLKYRALDGEGSKQKRKLLWSVVPAVICLLVVVSVNFYTADRGTFIDPEVSDINLLSTNEPLEFYAEEIEFYLWYLETESVDADLPGSGVLDPVEHTIPAYGAGEAGADRSDSSEPGNA